MLLKVRSARRKGNASLVSLLVGKDYREISRVTSGKKGVIVHFRTKDSFLKRGSNERIDRAKERSLFTDLRWCHYVVCFEQGSFTDNGRSK